jgi:16S rRNA (cytosine1402-N4)-methyltransferase
MRPGDYHEPVMVEEVVDALHIKKSGSYIDATIGTGGHSVEVVNRGGNVLGIDADPAMLAVAQRRLKEVCPTPNQKGLESFKLTCGNFKDIGAIARKNGFDNVDGILFDLGVSNIHLTSEARGFSFGSPSAPLDMRLDPSTQGVTGADLLNVLREDQLSELFSETLDRGSGLWLAKRVVEARSFSPVKTVGDFLNITQGLRGKPGLNPATLPFLAVRIAVNSELSNLKEALPSAFDLLGTGGRLVVISFHSKEDRLVKEFFKSKSGEARILTDKPLLPSTGETDRNPKARSAKMRVLQKGITAS